MHATTPRSSSRPRGGFTIVELTLTVAIMTLISTAMLISYSRYVNLARKSATRATFQQIDSAVYLYASDNDNQFPPSQLNGVAGAQCLPIFIAGCVGDEGGDNTPSEKWRNSKGVVADDGKEGFGYRKVARGRVYGPYNGVEQIPLKKPDGVDTAYPVFYDSFGGIIFYYRCDRSVLQSNYNQAYQISDHDSSKWAGNKGPITPGNAYFKNISIDEGEPRYFRTDFTLCSWGPNERWQNPTNPASDDNTNFDFARK